MPAAVIEALEMIKKNNIQFVDLRFTNMRGKEQHMSVAAHTVNENFFSYGKWFDGSSIAGFKAIHESDMVLLPVAESAVIDPFFIEPTLVLRCDILEPDTMLPYPRDPRSVAKRAEAYMKKKGIADACYFGPEPEFFVFDDVRWKISMQEISFRLDSTEGIWNSDRIFEGGNIGHRPQIKGGYFPVPPVDSSQDLRTQMCLNAQAMGLIIEAHHHEVANANQNEITIEKRNLLAMADALQVLKYVIHNTAHQAGKTATFMPKPLVGDNGSGMHCHQSLFKDGINLFAGEGYAGLSELALYYIGGIIKHARALNALTNTTTNSYKRLVPGFEAPINLAYSAKNRSAAIRIPATSTPQGARIEVRFPDPCINPYYAFAGMLMAGLDGIHHKIHPGHAIDKDLYELTVQEAKDVPTVCFSLQEALYALNEDREFLLAGGVFTDDIIDAYIRLKQSEIQKIQMLPHPGEFDEYYSL